jgi:formate hydrogenlyase subunit 6/NADH:ubiquinone oxidoreductase subunit I
VIDIVDQAKDWGVQDCICRKQKALVGDPCDHPLEVCLVLSPIENSLQNVAGLRTITREETLSILKTCAEAGLVHSVSNTQEGNYYICNCCTCSCGFLRGMADLGIANVMARSAFVNQVDEAECIACGACMDACAFQALTLEDTIVVNEQRCVGCGVCVPVCPTQALSLVRRPEDQIKPIPKSQTEWNSERLASRH